MFKTDMGSLAHDKIYNLLTAMDAIKVCIDGRDIKDNPSPVEKSYRKLEENSLDALEAMNAQVVAWLAAAIYQEKGIKDANRIDLNLKGRLEKMGVVDEAWEMIYPKRERPRG